jgi:homogentisate 1,2-dioxygenase
MPYYRVVGEIPRKRHIRFQRPDGGLYAEELMGEEGFVSDSSLLYHEHLPTAIVKSDGVPDAEAAAAISPNHPLLPRHFRTLELPAGGDLVLGRQGLLANDDVRISFAAADTPSELYRNSTGDETIYLRTGSARFESVYGPINVVAGDYVVVPRGTIHRWIPGHDPVHALVIEARGHIRPPRRYLSQYGQFLEHAPYSERDLRGPEGPLRAAGEDVPVLVRNRDGLTRLTYAQHPFDVVGWDGCLYPYAFNVSDFEPITGRVHQPPPAHQVFEGTNFVVCNFVPRKVDYHPLSIPVPYYHSNVDSDEVMFYCGGDYEARRGSGIGQGSISLHPGGHSHGPQPGAYERSIGVEFFDELAVMVDTFRPLELGEGGRAVDDGTYAWTWSGSGPTSEQSP